ncbi:MAG: type II secretion system minor pseudopilin GspI [Sphingorhabdus sp.]
MIKPGYPCFTKYPANGFTLIEMLVALAVFSLAALAMVNLQAFSVRTAATLSDSALAWQVAQNLAVERLSAPRAPAVGTEQGETQNGGRNWRWTVTTESTEDQRFVRIAIAVEGSGFGVRRKAQLTTARLVEK